MAAAGISSARQRNPRGYMALLSSAACEWFLMFLLFVDAALSYLLTKFARYCELQTPCLLCSRLDHIFGNKKPGYYQSLLCSNHREEISSLVYCHVHCNLADVRGMCEECFVSLAAENRLTMNQTWMDMYMKKNPLASSLGPWSCSCCNKSWKARSSAQKLVQLTPVGCGASTASVKSPLPRTPGCSRFNRQDSFKKIRDQLSGPKSPCSPGKIGVDHLSNVGYTELKFTSDSESEVPSDDEDGYYGLCRTNYSNSGNGGHPAKTFVQISSTDGVALGKTRQSSAEPDQFDLDQSMQLNANKDSILISHIKHGLGKLDWEPFSPKTHSPIMPKVMPLDDTPQLSGVSEVPHASGEISKPNISHFHMSGPSSLSDCIPLTNLPSSPTTVKIPEVNMTDSNHKGHNSVINDTTVTTGNSDNRASVTPTHMNLVDASAVSYRDSEIYHMPAEQSVSSGSPRIAEDAKSLLQTSAPEMDFLKNRAYGHHDNHQRSDGSPRIAEDAKSLLQTSAPEMDFLKNRAYDHHDDMQRSDGSSFDGKHVLQKTTSLEKSESGYESMDGFILSEIEGESMVDRLKRQVEHDQEALKDLYKELEEERNAAAIAANEAMAMITRLQEEKASLHMEASQHLRMMEEQAEFDMEALERANDLLAEKEKETQDLEAQLEQYRKMYRDGSVVSNLQKDDFKLKGSKGIVENHTVAQV